MSEPTIEDLEFACGKIHNAFCSLAAAGMSPGMISAGAAVALVHLMAIQDEHTREAIRDKLLEVLESDEAVTAEPCFKEGH